MSLDNIIPALKQRTLKLDCIEMTLVQNTDSDPISYKGNGFIRQTHDDRLTFELFANETRGTDLFKHLKATGSLQSGRLYRDTDYYALSVTERDGTVWTADRILPDCRWSANNPNPIVSGQFYTLATVGPAPDTKYSLRLHFFDDADLPPMPVKKIETADGVSWTRDTSKFSAASCDFVVNKLDKEFTVDASSAAPLNEPLHTRIQEALRYLLAKSVTWRVLIRHDGERQRLEIASGERRSPKTNLSPPIASSHEAFLESGWLLFSRYLEYVLRKTPHPYWNHCSYHLHNACEASGGSYDLWAIGVSVAVEGIVRLVEAPENAEERDKLKELQKNILDHVAAQPCFKDLVPRIEGLLGMMLETRVEDRLKPLIVSGHVDETHVKAWRKLRNRQAHPKEVDLKNMSTGDHQKLFDLIQTTTVLMYQVTFYLIGYEGKFSDYSKYNYPIRCYPLSLSTA